MKLTIIGAGGFRMPLIIRSIINRLDKLHIDELALMDIDGERLKLVGALTRQLEEMHQTRITICRTTDPKLALEGADFVITTFRIGGIESRVIDEQIPLKHGILGQETTGPGGFAMALRSIPVLLDYVELMQKWCPDAWLINFANPAGMLTEAVIRLTKWHRIVGICDAPFTMQMVISGFLHEEPKNVNIDYFGLNHLGWIKQVLVHNKDMLPQLIKEIRDAGTVPGLPFSVDLIDSLGLIPNEYLYYYYYAVQSVKNIINAQESRGEQIFHINNILFKELREKYAHNDIEGMNKAYSIYLQRRGETYMKAETGIQHDLSSIDQAIINTVEKEGYAGVALNLIEALSTDKSSTQVLNVANRGAIREFGDEDVVEIPARVTFDHIQPLPTTDIPAHCLGLMKLVKEYERLTINAAVNGSYNTAIWALTIHPLVHDYPIAKEIVNDYITAHKQFFPRLT